MIQKSKKLPVVHVIAGLGQGGAEACLVRLVEATKDECDSTVVSLSAELYYAPRITSAGAKVYGLNMPRGRLTMKGLFTLVRIMRERRPQIVQTWMYHADLLGGLSARLTGCKQVVWGIHNAGFARSHIKNSTRWVARGCSWISGRIPAAIVSCSQAAADLHVEMGYARDKMQAIPNGYDVQFFHRDNVVRTASRRSLNIDEDAKLIGTIARWDPVKDHATLLKAARIVTDGRPSVRFLLCGTGMSSDNVELRRLISDAGMETKLILLGPRSDIVNVMNALDLHLLTSRSEAFPNAVAESMACEVPNVVTNVGDAALIVGDSGWVAPPGESFAIAKALEQALKLSSEALREHGIAARLRICEKFSMERMVEAYLKLWKSLQISGKEIA